MFAAVRRLLKAYARSERRDASAAGHNSYMLYLGESWAAFGWFFSNLDAPLEQCGPLFVLCSILATAKQLLHGDLGLDAIMPCMHQALDSTWLFKIDDM